MGRIVHVVDVVVEADVGGLLAEELHGRHRLGDGVAVGVVALGRSAVDVLVAHLRVLADLVDVAAKELALELFEPLDRLADVYSHQERRLVVSDVDVLDDLPRDDHVRLCVDVVDHHVHVGRPADHLRVNTDDLFAQVVKPE